MDYLTDEPAGIWLFD